MGKLYPIPVKLKRMLWIVLSKLRPSFALAQTPRQQCLTFLRTSNKYDQRREIGVVRVDRELEKTSSVFVTTRDTSAYAF
jgi:hypothetical protein